MGKAGNVCMLLGTALVLAALSLFLIALITFVPPFALVFGLTALPGHLYLIALGLALIPIIVLEIAKAAGMIKHHQ